jgi:3-hydroxymyristoyl/3-hydroxydecanoyl-(acyl carrier protein) dehydratase
VLPHAYPFRLLDRREDGTVVLSITSGAPWLRGAAELPAALAVEALAQAAIVALAPANGEESPQAIGGLLAGIDAVRFHAPLAAGDRLEARAELLGRLGPLVKVHAELRRGDELVVEGDLLLAQL